MKKFLLSCAVLLSAVSFTVYAAQENSKDKKDKRDKIGMLVNQSKTT